jgi:hypothetical protein
MPENRTKRRRAALPWQPTPDMCFGPACPSAGSPLPKVSSPEKVGLLSECLARIYRVIGNYVMQKNLPGENSEPNAYWIVGDESQPLAYQAFDLLIESTAGI